jgi:CBS domain-containing protein
MNATDPAKLHSTKELIDALATARDRARIQLHLLSLDAREHWHELESKLDALQSKLERDGGRLTESAIKNARELTYAVKDLLQQNGGVAELTAPVSKLMKPVRSCRSNDTLNEPARLMWEFDCGAVPVVDDAGCLVGIITDRDICMAAYTRGQSLGSLRVESVMAEDVASVSPDDTLDTITALMRQRQIRRVPVVDDGCVVGIVSLADVARYVESDARFNAVLGTVLTHTLAEVSNSRPGTTSAAAE